jgi:hypothetical protein
MVFSLYGLRRNSFMRLLCTLMNKNSSTSKTFAMSHLILWKRKAQNNRVQLMQPLQLLESPTSSLISPTRRCLCFGEIHKKTRVQHLLSWDTRGQAMLYLIGSIQTTGLRRQSTTRTSLLRPCCQKRWISFNLIKRLQMKHSSVVVSLSWLSCGRKMKHLVKVG